MRSGQGQTSNRLIVVGAGPAGLSLALQLSRAGLPVTLLEASTGFSRQFRGDGLMPSGLEALARMGLWSVVEGLPQRALHSWEVVVEGRRLFEALEPMGNLQPARLLAQSALLEALLEQAQAQPSFSWQPGSRVQELLWQGERVVGVRLSDGRTLDGALVVGCDGRQSSVRQGAGLTLAPQGTPLEVLWFQLPAHPALLERNRFLTLVAGGCIASVTAGVDGQLQLGWVLSAEQRQGPSAKTLARLAPAWLADHIQRHAACLEQPLRLSAPVGFAPRWHRPGVLLLGDAAHPMSPVRAQGINLALRDSLVAASLLQQAWDQGQDAREACCRQIQALRSPEVRRMQTLQRAEAHQGHLLAGTPGLSRLAAALSPLLGPVAAASWRRRQAELRLGRPLDLPPAPWAPAAEGS